MTLIEYPKEVFLRHFSDRWEWLISRMSERRKKATNTRENEKFMSFGFIVSIVSSPTSKFFIGWFMGVVLKVSTKP